jgi:hypothetical protein
MTTRCLYSLIISLLLNPSIGLVGKAQNIHQISTYDDPRYSQKGEQRHWEIESHRVSLIQLDNARVFDTVQNRLLPKLTSRHRNYFKKHSAYKLLFSSAGDLFGNSRMDSIFIIYDQQKARISIILYNDSTDRYLELFRDMKVENGLASVDCSYSTFGTLDFQLGEAILYMKDDFMKRPDTFFHLELCKCTNISTDGALAHLGGCFAKTYTKSNVNNFTALCIATDFVYSNWECLKYDKGRNIFIIFYGQASAD